MQLLNTLSNKITKQRVNELVLWSHRYVGKPQVNAIIFNNKNVVDYQVKGYATYATKEIRINISDKIIALRYKRTIPGGKTVLIDPCGVEEVLIAFLVHEMTHLRLGGTYHKEVHHAEYLALNEWREIHPSSKVKRFVMALYTYFLVQWGKL